MGKLDGKVAVITSGSTGIGRGIGEAFLAEGAKIVINGRDAEKGGRALKEMNAGERGHFIRGDVTVREDVDAVVVIGTVIKGDTGHDEVVAHAAARAAADLALQFDKPVALGMTGPGMTREQAFDRIDNARNAVEAAVRMVRTLKDIGE